MIEKKNSYFANFTFCLYNKTKIRFLSKTVVFQYSEEVAGGFSKIFFERYIDVDFLIKNNSFHFGLFDKRDSSRFNIVRMPFKYTIKYVLLCQWD